MNKDLENLCRELDKAAIKLSVLSEQIQTIKNEIRTINEGEK